MVHKSDVKADTKGKRGRQREKAAPSKQLDKMSSKKRRLNEEMVRQNETWMGEHKRSLIVVTEEEESDGEKV